MSEHAAAYQFDETPLNTDDGCLDRFMPMTLDAAVYVSTGCATDNMG